MAHPNTGALDSKSVCVQHNFVNDFYCLECDKEICSQCLFHQDSLHQAHDTVKLKDYLTQVITKNKDF